MSRKIVAIGGGENARLKRDGTRYPYETANMDKEIIKLTEKEHPNFLFIAHSQNFSGEMRYYDTMKHIFKDFYGCYTKNLLACDLNNSVLVNELIEWADIIYEGGGDTEKMINLWNKTGFDKVLYQAWDNGKVMCGVSAGAMCWFNSGISDSLKIQLNDENAPFVNVKCLDFVKSVYTPHCEEKGRLESVKNIISNKEMIALSVSNCAAIEIVDNMYRIIKSEGVNRKIKPYVLKSYWKNGEYIETKIDNNNFKTLDSLLEVK